MGRCRLPTTLVVPASPDIVPVDRHHIDVSFPVEGLGSIPVGHVLSCRVYATERRTPRRFRQQLPFPGVGPDHNSIAVLLFCDQVANFVNADEPIPDFAVYVVVRMLYNRKLLW